MDIEEVIEGDRAATDESLRTERDQADSAIDAEIEEQTESKLEQTREKTDARLREGAGIEPGPHARDARFASVRRATAEAARSLADAAERLTQVARKLIEAQDPQLVATLQNVAATLVEAGRVSRDSPHRARGTG